MSDGLLVLPGMDELEPTLNNLEEDQLRSQRLRASLDPFAMFPAEWAERFLQLEERYRWELAVYAVWASVPKEHRQPPTLQRLASDVLGISARRLRDLRVQHPELEEDIKELRQAVIYETVPDVFAALAELATTPDFHNIPAMKLWLEMGQYYTPRQEVTLGTPRWVREASREMSELPEDELDDLAAIPFDDDEGVEDE